MDTTPKKMGRPPKEADDLRSAQLRIRLTEAERSLLDQAAGGEAGTSTWAREVLLRAARNAGKRGPEGKDGMT